MNNQQDDLTKLIARYLIVNLQGGGNPMYETDEMGVKSKGMDISGNVQAKIPLDKLISDAILKLNASGFGYSGAVKFPDNMQKMGAPDKIEYSGKGLDNIGIGFEKGFKDGSFGVDTRFNPQTNSKSINENHNFRF